jgi:hypothetical protein
MNLFEPTDQPGINEREELLAKWKDKPADELLNAKIESDLYIRTLERQKDELRQDYIKAQEDIQARANLQELIDKLNQKQEPDPVTPKDEKTATYDPKEIEQLVLNKIEENKLREKEQQNYLQVQNKLKERFGSHTANILREQAITLGLSDSDVNDLARKSPEAFFRIMGLQDRPSDPYNAPPRSDIRNDHFAPRIQKRTWSYYQDMKTKNPKQYWDPKTQVQMHKDADSLGDAFEDGDFKA